MLYFAVLVAETSGALLFSPHLPFPGIGRVCVREEAKAKALHATSFVFQPISDSYDAGNVSRSSGAGENSSSNI